MEKFEFGFGKDEDFNNTTQVTFFERVSIVFTDDELRELVDKISSCLNLETRERR